MRLHTISTTVLILLAVTAGAGDMRWTPVGPDGGTVYALAAHPGNPDTLYLGSLEGALYRSTDGAATWQRSVNDVPDRPHIAAVAASPHVPGLVLAAGTNRQMYRSTDGGLTWSLSSGGVAEGSTSFQGIIFHPSDGAVVYWWGTAADCGVFRSADAGVSWTCVSSDLPDRPQDVLMDPATPDTLYALMYNNGVWKTSNAGTTWIAVNAGLPDDGQGNRLTDTLTLNPSDPTRLYVSSDVDHHLYTSANGGGSWSVIAAPAQDILELWHHPTENRLYGTTWDETDPDRPECLLESTDGGATWTNLTPGTFTGGLGAHLTFDATDPARLWAALAEGVYVSTDYGATWSSSSTGFRGIDVGGIAIAPDDPLRYYFGSRSGLFRTTDGGATFTAVNDGLSAPLGEAISLHPNDSLDLLTDATTPHGPWSGSPAPHEDSGLVYTSDGGDTWTPAPNPEYPDGLGLTQVWDFARDPSDPDTVWAACPNWNWAAYGYTGGPFVSTDAGRTFTHQGNGLPDGVIIGAHCIAAVPGTAGPRVFFGTLDYGWGATLYRSDDGGSSWGDASTGTVLEGEQFRDILVDPTDSSTLYLGTNGGGVFRSTDAGVSWEVRNSGLPDIMGDPGRFNVLSLAADAQHPGVLYAGVADGDGPFGGIWWSEDGGDSWRRLAPGMGDAVVWEIMVDPHHDGHLLAGTRSSLWEITVDPGLIFVDGLETGGADLWSAAVP